MPFHGVCFSSPRKTNVAVFQPAKTKTKKQVASHAAHLLSLKLKQSDTRTCPLLDIL